ncbi:MAG: hypothetical protein E7201_00300 [Selenomonas ruminantium]|uniref:Uncharacterized protein n=1 Tax=Selenomonas ruminantium TaxID=971 RepID=A0A927ZQB1_SELRU|nr:hypothetical protein [Selenomonas ruminantium]
MGDKKNYAWPVTTMCKYDYLALQKFAEKNDNVLREKQIVIFGSGIRGTSFSIQFRRLGYDGFIFTDNNQSKVGGFINDFPIVSYEEIKKRRDQTVVIISVEGGFAIIEQLKNDGFVENKNFFYIESHLYENYVQAFCDDTPCKTLIMGDCGLTDLSIADTDFENAGEKLQRALGEGTTKVLAIHAMGMRAYYNIAQAHINHVQKPDTILLMTNLETFTGKQNLLPRSQHAPLMRQLAEALGSKDEGMNQYAVLTQERFSNYTMDYFTSSDEAMGSMSMDKNNKIVIKLNYMYRMDPENECVVYLKKFMAMCAENDIRLLLFIPPANYQYATSLWGDRFTASYEENTAFLKKVALEGNVPLLDLSYLLPSAQFADVSTIDETVNQEGREKVVAAIVAKYKELGFDD